MGLTGVKRLVLQTSGTFHTSTRQTARDILTDKGCSGAPDWVIEIVSKSNSSHDYVRKLVLYQKAGVREYWIVDPFQERVTVVNFEDQGKTEEYTYSDAVPSGVLEGLEIRFAQVKEGY